MKTKKRDIRDSGIRLKPLEHNILKNYSKYTKRKKKKKKKKKEKKRSVKEVQIKPKIDDIDKLLIDQSARQPNDIEIIDDDNKKISKEKVETKKIDIVKGKPDISENDPNIKKVKVDSIEEDSNKKGGGIIIG
jgi:hypothetical protein